MTIGPIDLAFTQPTHPLSQNKALGGHWASVRARLEPWKDAAWVTAHNHRVRALRARRAPIWRPKPITVQPVIQFRKHARRDPHNYTGTITKAIVDGLVRAKIVPDDTAAWVTVLDPVLEVQPDRGRPLTCTVRIRPREMFQR